MLKTGIKKKIIYLSVIVSACLLFNFLVSIHAQANSMNREFERVEALTPNILAIN